MSHVKFHKRLTLKSVTCMLVGSILLSACNTTVPLQNDNIASNASFERISPACITQVKELQDTLENAHASQYLSLANTAESCITVQTLSPQHPDLQIAMQFKALAFTNYVKAGDIAQAHKTLEEFRLRFPQQDLYFNDYTSFVDTATALLKQRELSAYQLSTLNINPALRSEIKRARNWSIQ